MEYYLCWIDDKPEAIRSLDGHIELLEKDYKVAFIVDEHYDTKDFDTIARNINDGLIFLVDYNLKNNKGEGIDGHEVIAHIREHDQTCKIVFYSSLATQEELRQLVGQYPNVVCALREDLQRILKEIAEGSFTV
jgi:hypothetical protein